MVFTPCIVYNTLNVIDEDKYPNLFHRILKKRFPRMSFRGIVDEIRHQGRQTSDLDLLTSRAFEREARASESSWRVLPHQTRKPCERLWEGLTSDYDGD